MVELEDDTTAGIEASSKHKTSVFFTGYIHAYYYLHLYMFVLLFNVATV